jgi:2-iminobutanoate/2-iminopropanoate deaminase
MTSDVRQLFEVYDEDPTVLRPLGLRVGDLIFGSGFSGLDFAAGAFSGDLGGQLRGALAKVRMLVERAGAGMDDVARIVCYLQTPVHREYLEAQWSDAFPDAARRPEIEVLSAELFEGEVCRLDALADAGRGEGAGAGLDRFQQILACGDENPLPAAVRLGQLIFAPALSAADPCSGRLNGGNREGQVRAALQNMDRMLEAAGIGRGQVARVAFYMRDVVDRDDLHRVWQEWYPDPDDRPPHIYLPVPLPPGCEVLVQVLAVAQGDRRVLAVEGIRHGDPMSMGASTGALVTSSRVMAGPRGGGGIEEWTRACFDNIEKLIGQEGANWPDVKQVTAYLSDPQYSASVVQEWQSRAGNGSGRLDVRQSLLGRDLLLPRLLVLAVKPDENV